MRAIIVSICLLLGICTGVGAETAREIRVGGGGASCKAFFGAIHDVFEAETGLRMVVTPTTPVQGLIELNNGQLDVVASPLPLASMIKGAARNGIIIDAGLFAVRKIGASKVKVFVNKSNNIASLTKKQLQDIFSGKVRNWKQVGGENREIVVVWGLATPGQNELFTRQLLDGKAVTPSAMEVFDYGDIRDAIAKTPGAIGIDPQGFATSSLRTPKAPEVESEVIVITKGQPTADVDRLLKYIKEYSW